MESRKIKWNGLDKCRVTLWVLVFTSALERNVKRLCAEVAGKLVNARHSPFSSALTAPSRPSWLCCKWKQIGCGGKKKKTNVYTWKVTKKKAEIKSKNDGLYPVFSSLLKAVDMEMKLSISGLPVAILANPTLSVGSILYSSADTSGISNPISKYPIYINVNQRESGIENIRKRPNFFKGRK